MGIYCLAQLIHQMTTKTQHIVVAALALFSVNAAFAEEVTDPKIAQPAKTTTEGAAPEGRNRGDRAKKHNAQRANRPGKGTRERGSRQKTREGKNRPAGIRDGNAPRPTDPTRGSKRGNRGNR